MAGLPFAETDHVPSKMQITRRARLAGLGGIAVTPTSGAQRRHAISLYRC